MENFDQFVTAHLEWRSKLAGKHRNSLDLDIIRCDDKCEIGKWIYGPGEVQYGDLPELSALRAAHAAFHEAVATSFIENDEIGSDIEFEVLVRSLKRLSVVISHIKLKTQCKKDLEFVKIHISNNSLVLAQSVADKPPCGGCKALRDCDIRTEILQVCENARERSRQQSLAS
jgi:hypothetical protein